MNTLQLIGRKKLLFLEDIATNELVLNEIVLNSSFLVIGR
jgi:hypothetical protein